MSALLFLSVCAASAVADGDFCFPRGFGGTENPICLSWARNGADFELQMNCPPDGHPEFSVGWCAVGLSTATPPGAPLPATWGMWPAEVFHLQATRSAAGSAPVVELTDRLTVGARLPACMPTQASQLLSAHVDAATGVRSTLLPFCAFARWVPDSDVAVAQRRGSDFMIGCTLQTLGDGDALTPIALTLIDVGNPVPETTCSSVGDFCSVPQKCTAQ
jgi:hypothetical protein